MTTPPEDRSTSAADAPKPATPDYSAAAADKRIIVLPLIVVTIVGTITTIIATVVTDFRNPAFGPAHQCALDRADCRANR